MQRVTKDHAVLTLSDKHTPSAYASDGDVVLFETLDCFSNQLTREDQCASSVTWDHINPATGPLYVKEAKVGDTLCVEILDIKLEKQGVTAVMPGGGVYGSIWKEEKTRIVKVEGNQVQFSDKIILEAKPMIGVIGTAPANGEAIPTGSPGAHGGNMDCKMIGVGAKLYLPVHVDGALLAMGDVHAVMGDGEVSICGIEIGAEVTVKLSVLKDCKYPLPFLENDTHVMTLYSDEDLNVAADGAALHMLQYMKNYVGMDEAEAAMLLSAIADLKICQVVDPLKTCRMELAKELIQQLN